MEQSSGAEPEYRIHNARPLTNSGLKVLLDLISRAFIQIVNCIDNLYSFLLAIHVRTAAFLSSSFAAPVLQQHYSSEIM
jgi:hypothetical protein